MKLLKKIAAFSAVILMLALGWCLGMIILCDQPHLMLTIEVGLLAFVLSSSFDLRPTLRKWRVVLACSISIMMIASAFVFIMVERGGTRRERISRARADMRRIAVALEEYYSDHRMYPGWSIDQRNNAFGLAGQNTIGLLRQPTFLVDRSGSPKTLTTPVAYLLQYDADPVCPVKDMGYCYYSANRLGDAAKSGWILWSPGPDGDYDLTIDNIAQAYDPDKTVPSALMIDRYTFDLSNGTNSNGDVYRCKQ